MATHSGAVAAVAAILLGLAAVLAGCVQQHEPARPGVSTRLETGPGFFFNRDEDVASLAYGLPQSDNVTLFLQCEAGKRRVEIMDGGHRDAKSAALLTLSSGGVESKLPAGLEPDEENGGTLAVAHASSDLPALQAFRKTGVISVKLGVRQYVLTASTIERPTVARFFAVCERK